MIYSDFEGIQLSRLGFGTMRLPAVNGVIDMEQTQKMVDYAMAHGVNYYDTAYPYMGSQSEAAIGKALAKYPRDSFYLATKYPGHQIASKYDPEAVFEEQLKKCGVEYFDFYLLHNVCENSLKVYRDEKWGIIDYFIRQRQLGRIRHLGFSTHGKPEMMKEFLDEYGDHMEFCQIQLNYLDWTLQQGEEKVALLKKYGIPVWVMEPVRGGKLADLPAQHAEKLSALRPGASCASWGMRFLIGIDECSVILSGMSNMEQMIDNVSTFEKGEKLTADETELLLTIAEDLKGSVPCTGCRYCTEGCPMGLDIPKLIATYNDVKYQPSMNISMYLDSLPAEKKPASCIGCGACAAVCPQKIDIPGVMKDFAELIPTLPDWAKICKERELAALRQSQG